MGCTINSGSNTHTNLALAQWLKIVISTRGPGPAALAILKITKEQLYENFT